MATRKATTSKVVTTEAESLNAELSSDISKLSETALKSFKRAIDQRLTQLEQEDSARKERERVAAEKAAKIAAETAHKVLTGEIDRITGEANTVVREAKRKVEQLIQDFRETHDQDHDYYISAYIGDAEYNEGNDNWVTSSY